MDDFKAIIIGVLAAVNIFFTSYFGAFTPLLVLVIILMVSDLGTRIYAAAVRTDERPESKKVWQGLYKKLGMCMLIFLTLLLDAGLLQLAQNLGINITSKIIFTGLTLAWIFVRELISNLENLAWAGVDLPQFIIKALNIVKEKVDDLGDNITGGDKHEDNR